MIIPFLEFLKLGVFLVYHFSLTVQIPCNSNLSYMYVVPQRFGRMNFLLFAKLCIILDILRILWEIEATHLYINCSLIVSLLFGQLPLHLVAGSLPLKIAPLTFGLPVQESPQGIQFVGRCRPLAVDLPCGSNC